MKDKKILLEAASDLFLRYGVRSITMDDLARELGISKKTLYQHVENKRDLVKQVMNNHLEQEKCSVGSISEETSDAVHEMVEIGKYVLSVFKKLSPGTIYDLKKYYRKIWDQWEGPHRTHIYNIIKANLEKGIKEGLYRDDFNPDIVARFYVAKAVVITDDDVFPTNEYPKQNLYLQYIDYHMHGILSSKGEEIYKQYSDELLKSAR